MSAQCPRCGTTLKDDYGMTQCPSCGVFAFVDMEGNATVSDDAESPPEIGGETPALSPIESPDPLDPIAPIEPMDFQMNPPEEPAQDLSETTGFEPSNIEVVPDLGPDEDPLGLSDFANSEVSSGKDGPYLFRILILGIDTKEIRESIREALEDSRFGWDADRMLARLDKGRLTIENLAPVKATIIIQRLRHLPVKIRWEQYAISQIEPS